MRLRLSLRALTTPLDRTSRHVGPLAIVAAPAAHAAGDTSWDQAALFGVLVLILGALATRDVVRRRRRRQAEEGGTPSVRTERRPVVVVAVLVTLVVAALVAGGIFAARSRTPQANPFPPAQASIAAGRALYEQECVSCHGVQGRGDGPEAARLNPPPLDLTTHVPMHEDAQVFDSIARGMPGTAMPAFRGRLTDDQIWHLVNYLRDLTSATRQSR